jgi:hypothetical protein
MNWIPRRRNARPDVGVLLGALALGLMTSVGAAASPGTWEHGPVTRHRPMRLRLGLVT